MDRNPSILLILTRVSPIQKNISEDLKNKILQFLIKMHLEYILSKTLLKELKLINVSNSV
jgi:hypothetical protein